MSPNRITRQRLDLLLVERGLAPSRERAQALILAGEVRIGGRVADKPGQQVSTDTDIAVAAQRRYVSRGAEKLAHALDTFHCSVDGLTLADVGASTGGFSDVLLQRGARRVYAIDVGYGQLDWRIRQDPRVVVMERTNARYLDALPELIDAAVFDVSFISLELILPPALRWLQPAGWIVALVKPQFEAGRGQVGKGGVVRDPEIHRAVVEKILRFGESRGLGICGCTASPITGPAGNREFLVCLQQVGPGMTVEEALQECRLQQISVASGPP